VSPRRVEPHHPPAWFARELGWSRPRGSVRQWSWELLCDLAAEHYHRNRAKRE
jgi:hypothetical protein